ncbi:MAG TPA: M20/M25/M40 family metallo-hydrolase [Ignavibacteriaceae bacterium]|nr:M20/M25/M40 family metallo-hydrolase [Ignavibacteriaceae bacterium]
MRILLFLLVLNTSFIAAQISEAPKQSVNEFISEESLLQKVELLCSPEFAGRLSGSEGYNKASDYVRNHFKELVLKPAFDGDYYQKLLVEFNEITAPAEFSLVKDGKVFVEYKLGIDYAFRGFTGSGNFTAPVVFCGYGISHEAYDDYKDVDVTGKVVIVFKQNPNWKIEGVNWNSGYPREKAKTAADRGAVGLIMVSRPLDKTPQPVIGSVMHGGGSDQNENFPQLQMSLDAANDFLTGTGYYIEDLQAKIDDSQKPFSFELPASALIKVNADYYKEKETQNIAAILEGSDEKLKNEFIIIGAHLDHVGSQAGQVYYPGANDNASGSAAVMQLAEAFAKSGIKTKRSIIFTLFASEEQGLFGAEYFVNNSPVELDNIIAMLNMDCIASGDSIQIGNGKSTPELWQIFREIDLNNDNLMLERTWSGGGADATPFHNKGIPTAYIVTYYSYVHLHLPSDLPETLNSQLYESVVKLTSQAVIKLANGEYKREKLVD